MLSQVFVIGRKIYFTRAKLFPTHIHYPVFVNPGRQYDVYEVTITGKKALPNNPYTAKETEYEGVAGTSVGPLFFTIINNFFVIRHEDLGVLAYRHRNMNGVIPAKPSNYPGLDTVCDFIITDSWDKTIKYINSDDVKNVEELIPVIIYDIEDIQVKNYYKYTIGGAGYELLYEDGKIIYKAPGSEARILDIGHVKYDVKVSSFNERRVVFTVKGVDGIGDISFTIYRGLENFLGTLFNKNIGHYRIRSWNELHAVFHAINNNLDLKSMIKFGLLEEV